MIVVAEKKINRISLCCKTIEIQISSFAGFASIRQTPTELPRQAGEWRMLLEVLPSALALDLEICHIDYRKTGLHTSPSNAIDIAKKCTLRVMTMYTENICVSGKVGYPINQGRGLNRRGRPSGKNAIRKRIHVSGLAILGPENR